jgi:hypothetical protein
MHSKVFALNSTCLSCQCQDVGILASRSYTQLFACQDLCGICREQNEDTKS